MTYYAIKFEDGSFHTGLGSWSKGTVKSNKVVRFYTTKREAVVVIAVQCETGLYRQLFKTASIVKVALSNVR